MSLFDKIEEVKVTSLKGLGASYRIAGAFRIRAKDERLTKIQYKGVAFGGHFGGHNVNVQISSSARKKIIAALGCTDQEVDNILAEVQRRLLNGEMIVEYDKLKPDEQNPVGSLGTPL
jgi:hypothetical protein